MGQLYDLVSDAKDKWFGLGLQLGFNFIVLEGIKKICSDTQMCYMTMLSAWLTCTQPRPSWEALLAALEHDSVQCGNLAEIIRKRQSIAETSPHHLQCKWLHSIV